MIGRLRRLSPSVSRVYVLSSFRERCRRPIETLDEDQPDICFELFGECVDIRSAGRDGFGDYVVVTSYTVHSRDSAALSKGVKALLAARRKAKVDFPYGEYWRRLQVRLKAAVAEEPPQLT